MLINETYFLPVIAVIAILIFITVYFLLKNRLNQKSTVYTSLGISFILFFILKTVGGRVYVIDENLNASIHKSIGSFNIEIPAKGGAELSCNVHMNRTGIVNKSGKTLLIEGVFYGTSDYAHHDDSPKRINAYSFKEVFLPRGIIDYFFDDELPKEIRVGVINNSETKYWIHQY